MPWQASLFASSRQLVTLLHKNWLLLVRNRTATIVQLICPVVFIVVLFLIGLSTTTSSYNDEIFKIIKNPQQRQFNSIPICQPYLKSYCYTFAFTPNDSITVQNIVNNIRLKNTPVIPGLKEPYGIIGFATQTDLDDFLWSNQNITQAAYSFSFNESSSPRVYSWALQFNASSMHRYGNLVNPYPLIHAPMYDAVTEELHQIIGGNDTRINRQVVYRNFPHPEVSPFPLVSTAGSLFLLGALMFNFVALTTNIVREKERHLREIMTQVGLYDSAYWLSWFLIQSAWTLYTVMALIATGAACQFYFFLHNNFGTYFVTFWLFGMTLVPASFIISTLVRRASSAAATGFLVFLVSLVVLLVGGSSIYVSSTADIVKYLFAVFSPAPFAKALNDLDFATRRKSDPGLSWSNRGSYSDEWPLTWIWNAFIVDFFIYTILAMYLDNVIANDYGVRKSYLYFCYPSYWCGATGNTRAQGVIPPRVHIDGDQKGPDVHEEEDFIRAQILNRSNQSHTPLFVAALRKEYKTLNCCKQEKFIAVNDLCFHIERNRVTCLLGPNGAGKSTTISMLTGLVQPSSGDALIFGRSILTDMPSIRPDIGICPQFEVYWEELTGREHLALFAALKGVESHMISTTVEQRLREVAFKRADMDALAENYSGGMKRRLAVAIAFIGSPRVVFLDEPTTGMDPVSKREVWRVIQRAKAQCSVILTTHSMEEADILGDKIAIIVHGSLRVFDNSFSLKQRRGAGYRVTIKTAATAEATAMLVRWLEGNVPHQLLSNDIPEHSNAFATFRGFVTFSVLDVADVRLEGPQKDRLPICASEERSLLATFFEQLEAQHQALQIETVQVSMTTLEEVFTQTTK